MGAQRNRRKTVKHPSVRRIRHIDLESEQMYGCFEPTSMPAIFSMLERPLCRVGVIDFYKIKSAPPYLKSKVDILVKYCNQGWCNRWREIQNLFLKMSLHGYGILSLGIVLLNTQMTLIITSTVWE